MHKLTSERARATTALGLVAAIAAASVARPARAQAASPARAAAQRAPAAPAAGSDTLQRLHALVARPGGLTAREAGQRAARTSYDVRAKQQRSLAAASDVSGSQLAYYPRLTLTARYVRLSPITNPSLGPSGVHLVATPAGEGPLAPGAPLVGVPTSALSFPVILNQYTLQANVTVPVSDYLLRTSQSYAAASHSEKAAKIDARAARLAARLQGELAYYAWARARLEQAVAEQSVEQARAHLRAARIAFRAHAVSKADVLRAESALAHAQLLAAHAENLAARSEDALRTAMHDTTSRHYAIGEDLFAPLPPAARRGFYPLYTEALRRRLEIRALDQTAWSLNERSRAARAGNYPRLDAFADAYYANPNPRYIPPEEKWHATWDVGVQLTWSPNDAGTSSAAARALDARRAEIEAQKRALEDALRREVMRAYQDEKEAELAIATSAQELKSAEEAYRVETELYAFGRATSVEVTDAETELLRARLAVIDARVELRAARARLEHAVGRDAGSS